jgi:hypothetical protein
MGCSFSSILFHVTKHGDFHLVMQRSLIMGTASLSWQEEQLQLEALGKKSTWRYVRAEIEGP